MISFLFAVELVPSNVDKLYRLLSDMNEMKCYQLAKELRVDVAPSFQPDPGMRMIEAFFREILRTWLSRENPKPSWDELTSALMDMKYVVLASNIMQMGRYI